MLADHLRVVSGLPFGLPESFAPLQWQLLHCKYSKMFFTFPNISQKFFQTLAEVSVCAAVKAAFRSAAVVYTQRLVCGAPFDFNENTILNSGGDGIPTRADVGMSTGAIPIISSTRTVSPGVVEVEDEMEGLAMPDMIVRFYDFYCLV
jgi:hypothetical protein